MSNNNNNSGGGGKRVSNDSGGGSDNCRQVSIVNQLIDASLAKNWETLCEILSQQHQNHQDDDRYAVTDNDIDRALRWLARHGCLEACRLLWARLSPNAKQKYTVAESDDPPTSNHHSLSPLHDAVLERYSKVVHFLLEELNFNVHQKDRHGRTPLGCASGCVHMSRLLLDAGADPNRGGQYGPIYSAVNHNNTQVVRLLLQRGADPNLNRRPSNEEKEDDNMRRGRRSTDLAIYTGNTEILSMLLQHGAFVDAYNHFKSLNTLLCRLSIARDIKLAISRLLVEHAKSGDQATASFMQRSLEIAIKNAENNKHYCKILLEAGMDSRTVMYTAIQAGSISLCQLLVREHNGDPFLEMAADNMGEVAVTSPFHAAARLPDTSIFQYFLEVWNERFSSSGGKNDDGDYPIHVICCDAHVSLQAMELVVIRQAETVSTVDGEQGLLPFHFAAMWDTSLEVIFYLLRHCPNTLLHRHHHVRNAGIPAVLAAAAADADDTANGSTFKSVETNNDNNE